MPQSEQARESSESMDPPSNSLSPNPSELRSSNPSFSWDLPNSRLSTSGFEWEEEVTLPRSTLFVRHYLRVSSPTTKSTWTSPRREKLSVCVVLYRAPFAIRPIPAGGWSQKMRAQEIRRTWSQSQIPEVLQMNDLLSIILNTGSQHSLQLLLQLRLVELGHFTLGPKQAIQTLLELLTQDWLFPPRHELLVCFAKGFHQVYLFLEYTITVAPGVVAYKCGRAISDIAGQLLCIGLPSWKLQILLLSLNYLRFYWRLIL